MAKDLIFGILGGLGLFIYGIHLMGEGLQKAAGDQMRKILGALTGKPLRGLLVGAGVTALIQSSSATTVMTIGFVNAGLMTLTQAIGVIFGANVGTTITGQLIAFKLTNYALPIIGVGMAMNLFAKTKKMKHIGQFLLGFGILFLGLKVMTGVVKPFGASETARNLFVNFSKNPILGVITGMLVTFIAQSSSVTVGLVLALASVGLIDLSAAIPLILGDNIGTCITAMLASIGTSISARRAAVAHMMFNVLGTVVVLILLPYYQVLIAKTSTEIMRQCANAHTIFNVMNALIFLPFTHLFAKLIVKIVPGEDVVIEAGPKYLEKHLLETPVLALEAVMKEIVRTLELTRKMVNQAMEGFFNSDLKVLDKVDRGEDAVDDLRLAITDYLVELMQRELTAEQSKKIPALIHVINDVERIGDHAENLKDLAERKIGEKMPFSDFAIGELHEIHGKIDLMCESTIQALETNDIASAETTVEREKEINSMRNKFKQNHIKRLDSGLCKVLSGVIFLDMVSNFEKIGDHLNNIGQAVMYPLQWELTEHV
ncbi:MAG: Na/Pi cotransporter family protein [bacterium]